MKKLPQKDLEALNKLVCSVYKIPYSGEKKAMVTIMMMILRERAREREREFSEIKQEVYEVFPSKDIRQDLGKK